jgi:hypothetical protein
MNNKYTIKSTSEEGIYYLVNGWNKCKTFWINERSVLENKENAKLRLQGKPPPWSKQYTTCEHCKRQFDLGNFARYHGDKCKLKN